jgi:UDP-N-acetylmuramate dehydrogenase
MSLNPRLRAKLERQSELERRLTREQKDELAKALPKGQVLFDELSSHHSIARAGGAFEAFAVVRDIKQLKRVLEWCEAHTADYRYWGEGAFTLVRDGGLPGLVIKLGDGFQGIAIERTNDDDVFVAVGAAVGPREIVSFCETEGLSGFETFASAQGTIGGLLCASSMPDGWLLEGLVEELTMVTRDRKELSLKTQALRFEEGRLKIPRTAGIIKVLLKLKRSTTADVARGVEKYLRASDGDVPRFAFAFSSPVKAHAAVLIEEAGLKGVRVGGARISQQNACSIVNEGEVKARDIAVLLNLVKDRVKQSSLVALDATIEVIGER